jgi:hypothetical protein
MLDPSRFLALIYRIHLTDRKVRPPSEHHFILDPEETIALSDSSFSGVATWSVALT